MEVTVSTQNHVALIRALSKHGSDLITPTDAKGVFVLSGEQITEDVLRDLEDQGLIESVAELA